MRRAAQLSFDDARRKAPAGPALTVLPDAARVEEHLVRPGAPVLDRRGLADPNRALRLSIDALAAGGELPAPLRSAPEITFDAIFDWTPLRVRMVAVLAGRLRVRVRLPWSALPDLREAVEPALRAFEALGGDQAAPELELFDPAEGGGLSDFLHAPFGGAGPARGAPVALRACASPTAQAREGARTRADLIAARTPPHSIAPPVRRLA